MNQNKKLSTNEVKNLQLRILIEVDKFCRNNDIKYTITAGTLIGAIRHKGFIPWDDDIDICMLREDYNKFIFSFKSDWCHVDSFEKNNKFLFPFAKISDNSTAVIEKTKCNSKIGVNIDLFPEDGVPKGKKGIKHCNKLLFLCKLFSVKQLIFSNERSLFKNFQLFIFKLCLVFISRKVIISKIVKNAKKYNTSSCDDVCNLVWGIGYRGTYPKRYFDNIIDVIFENKKFCAIKEYDAWLRKIYGDYMVLPPEEKRATHHGFDAHIIEK